MTRRLIAAGVAAAYGICLAAEIAPFASPEDTRTLGEDEQRVWSEAREFDRNVRNLGHLFGDAALDAYLQEIVDSLYPELRGILRVSAVRDPRLNAFALPNGSLYVHIGLIGRAENEAQIAAVVAHEAAHFVHRHGLRQRRSVKDAAAVSAVAGMIGGVAGLIGTLAAVSSAFGYSRDLEREADRQGFERMLLAGYSVREGAKIFEILEAESRLLEINEPFFFSSHPRLRERIESYRELAARDARADGRVDAERFLKGARAARIGWLEAELDRAQHKSVIHHLTRDGAGDRYPPYSSYYLAEAYRLRAEEGDEQKAEAACRQALAAAPEFAPPYRALGLLLLKRRDYLNAKSLFEQYLRLAPRASDRGYVESYLEQIEQAVKDQPS